MSWKGCSKPRSCSQFLTYQTSTQIRNQSARSRCNLTVNNRTRVHSLLGRTFCFPETLFHVFTWSSSASGTIASARVADPRGRSKEKGKKLAWSSLPASRVRQPNARTGWPKGSSTVCIAQQLVSASQKAARRLAWQLSDGRVVSKSRTRHDVETRRRQFQINWLARCLLRLDVPGLSSDFSNSTSLPSSIPSRRYSTCHWSFV